VSWTRFRTDELEAIAYEVWRAPEVVELDGWRLRYAHGFTGRANSVWPNGEGTMPLDEKLDHVESWYRERSLPPMFQLTEAAKPRGLDDALAARGYERRGGPMSVQTASLEDVVARTHGDATVSEHLDDDWVALWADTRGFDRLDVVRALLAAGRAVFARVDDVAIGRGVAVGEWLGITSMVTLPRARRRGHGRAILHALARWATTCGCTRAILQVEHGNTPAAGLYASAGFVPHHDYHYRKLP
jgi:GNAT superfamily N-acetyltransferase